MLSSELYTNACKKAKNDEELNETLERIFSKRVPWKKYFGLGNADESDEFKYETINQRAKNEDCLKMVAEKENEEYK